MSVPTITLNNGVQIPQLGFGVFQVEPQDTKRSVLLALEVGYRHIDTAQMYENEAEVGQAVRESGIDRDQVFITSKLSNGKHDPDDAQKAFEESVEKLDGIDLFLMHWPLPKVGDYVETWKAMEEMLASGRTRAIGVSNFQQHHLERLLSETTVVPAANQVEVHPYLSQDPLRAFCGKHGIAVEGWSPIAQGKVLDDPAITAVALELGKDPAQVVLRWHLQRGDVVFPKATSREHVQCNFDVFGFELSDGQMGRIDALNRDERTGPDPDVFNMIP